MGSRRVPEVDVVDRDVMDLAVIEKLPPGQEPPKVDVAARKRGTSVNRGAPSPGTDDAPTGNGNSSATGEKAHPNDEERKNLLGIVRRGHGRVDPCFMTGKGCVYTDHIDKALRDRSLAERVKGFMIMPYRPRLGVFFENCLRPFFYANYDKYGPEGMPPEEPKYITLERADDVARPGVIVCEGICKRIQESDFVIADISVPNDNVFYELGLAYGIGSKIVLIYQEGSQFGSMMAEYLDESRKKSFGYVGLNMIKREEFRVSDYLWTRPAPTENKVGKLQVLFYEKMWKERRSEAGGPDGSVAAPAGLDDQIEDDIQLTFKQHVMSDLGIALDRIVKALRRQQLKGNDEVPREYLDKHIENLKEPVDVKPPDDFRDMRGDFAKTRDLVDASYCLVVRTGVDCDPMAYFWLGYGHALGKNAIPITQLVIDKSDTAKGRSGLRELNGDVGKWVETRGRSRGKIIDLAFDIRTQRHMTFDPEHPELLEKQLEQTLGEMIRTDFAEWSRKRFWATLLDSRGEVSIITGGLHSDDHNREVVGDWDLRAASELTSYFSRHQYRPKIETPIYQPELARGDMKDLSAEKKAELTEWYIDQVIEDIGIKDKNCVVIASPDVNPLTEILLGRLFGVEDSKLFPTESSEGHPLDGLPNSALLVYKKRKRPDPAKTPSGGPTGAKSPLHRAFYAEAEGDAPDTEFRGFYSGSFDGRKDRLLPYYGQHDYGAEAGSSKAKKSFDLYAQLIVARNPFTTDGDSRKYVVILNGVSGPATAALTQVLTGRGNEDAESSRRAPEPVGEKTFNPADEAESILSKLLPLIEEEDFYGIYSIIKVTVGDESSVMRTGPAGTGGTSRRQAGAGKTSDWRSILRWELDEDILDDGAVKKVPRPKRKRDLPALNPAARR